MKVVINKCYGGFGLSHKAMMRYFELKGWDVELKVNRISAQIYKELYGEELTLEKAIERDDSYAVEYYVDGKYFTCLAIPRDDPDLVKVVEELGKEANGKYAELKIVEIPDDVDWVIQEYDGIEWVAEKHRTWE